ncbi:hypothetical protein CO652_23785 [Rhizobium sp. H4]|nr:hypothetical protein CO652_23785 [Rhizobium sp. H4]
MRNQQRRLSVRLTEPAYCSFVMLGLVPSICIRLIGQQILGTRPRMTRSKRQTEPQRAFDFVETTAFGYVRPER